MLGSNTMQDPSSLVANCCWDQTRSDRLYYAWSTYDISPSIINAPDAITPHRALPSHWLENFTFIATKIGFAWGNRPIFLPFYPFWRSTLGQIRPSSPFPSGTKVLTHNQPWTVVKNNNKNSILSAEESCERLAVWKKYPYEDKPQFVTACVRAPIERWTPYEHWGGGAFWSITCHGTIGPLGHWTTWP